MLRVLRFIEKSNFYDHFNSPQKSSTAYIYLICLKLTELMSHHKETIYVKYQRKKP